MFNKNVLTFSYSQHFIETKMFSGEFLNVFKIFFIFSTFPPFEIVK